ncbi:RDD family protein [Methylibium rhizosphaerae]|uniref:RDD family protein n=1 Tax=Methylibium rhizosphaerae TaxID=2570323 RepID=UPI0011269FEF|nr:RDD family protein [Methylibium rhizosphaerae]
MTAASAVSGAAVADLRAPSLRRRLASFLYEGVLLFGVVFVAGIAYSVVSQQRHALQGRQGMILAMFLVLGVYFVWYWSRTGQTLAMQTWHVRLVGRDGQPVSRLRALARYLASWVWFLPSLAIAYTAGWHHSAWAVFGCVLAGVLLYALLSFLHPQRQFLHDALCGTRLIHWRPAPPARPAA